jgi:broad specificity phosphatase PhoE
LRKRYPREVERWFHSPMAVRIPAPRRGQFRRRVVRAMNRIRKENPTGEIAVVTHAGVICAYLTSVLGMSLDDLWSFKIRNASVTRVLFPQGKARIDLLGDIHHLEVCSASNPIDRFACFREHTGACRL